MDRLTEIVTRRSEETRLRVVGERQIVCALRDSRVLRGIDLLQSFRHAVELRAKRFQFIAGPHLDALVELALTDLPRASLELSDRSYHAAREQQTRRHRSNHAK